MQKLIHRFAFIGSCSIFCLCIFGAVRAQSPAQDIALLRQKVEKKQLVAQAKQERRFRPVAFVFGLGLKAYQAGISEQLATNCAFETTCSRFSSQLVHEFGFVKGYFLTFDRISRCTKISSMETYPIRLNGSQKIKETVADFRMKQ